MGGRAESDSKKNRRKAAHKAAAMVYAANRYREEQSKKARGELWKGSRAIAEETRVKWRREHKQDLVINHQTIINHAAGMATHASTNAARGWLTEEEVEIVIAYIIELGRLGFPLSHRRLKEHVDEILRAKLGDAFPEGGVGKGWTHRFVEKHSDRIRMAWATPLEEKRGRAVNPNTKAAWDELYGSTVKKYNIKAENLYGTDEIGVAGTSGQKERVMSGKRKGPAYQQSGGNRENTTVIVTICADGTSDVAPAVIMKGSAYSPKWAKGQDPAKAT
jgi:hypothetical protein